MRCQLVERGIIHRRQELGIGRLPVRSEDAQGPCFLGSRLQLVAKGLPFQLQRLIGFRLLDDQILSIQLAILQISERATQAIAILLAIGVTEGHQRIGEYDMLTFHPIVTIHHIIEKVYILLTASEIEGRRTVRPKFLTRLVTPNARSFG